MSDRLTEADLRAIADGKDWRDVSCGRCGRSFIVAPDLRMFSCTCRMPEHERTEAGPRATARLVAEFTALRAIMVKVKKHAPSGDFETCGWCSRGIHKHAPTCPGEEIERLED